MTRIDRLEQLVLSAVSNQPQPAKAVLEIPQFNAVSSGCSIDSQILESNNEAHVIERDDEVDQLSTAFGVMKVDPGKTIYLGGAHWVSIMSEVSLQYRTLCPWLTGKRYMSSETFLTPITKSWSMSPLGSKRRRKAQGNYQVCYLAPHPPKL